MALRTTLIVLTGLSGALFLGSGPCHAQPATARPVAEPRLTLVFSNVQVTEVLERLRTQGINFVVGQGELEPDRRVTLNLVDQPQGVALDLVAEALGGHWERRGEVYVYRKGPGGRGGAQAVAVAEPPVRSAPDRAAIAKPAAPARPRQAGPGERVLVSYSLASPLGSRAKAFLDSLTQAQTESHRKRGYLMASELTLDQRKLLGGMDALRGRLDVRLGVDRESVTIKGDIPAAATKKPAAKKPARRTKGRRRG